jgi:hypothetical protein
MPNTGLIVPDILRLIGLLMAGAGPEEIVLAIVSDVSQIFTAEEQAKILETIEGLVGKVAAAIGRDAFRRGGPVPLTNTDEIRADLTRRGRELYAALHPEAPARPPGLTANERHAQGGSVGGI